MIPKNTLTYCSVCSGIEAVSVAWRDLPFRPLWFSEIEAFPCAVLAHHWPDIPNQGDMTTLAARISRDDIPAPDILIGGTPCQSFSIAGMKLGLNDPRGQLTLAYIRLADAVDQKRKEKEQNEAIIVWENVPGVLSDSTNAFGHFLAGLAGADNAFTPGNPPAAGKSSTYWRWSKKARQHIPKWPRAGCVYGARRTIAWIVRDAQHFGLAQRRKRLYLIAGAGEDFDPAEILFEFTGLRRNTAPGGSAESPATGSATAGTGGESDYQTVYNKRCVGVYAASHIHSTCTASDYKDAHDLVVFPAVCIAANTIERKPQSGGHHLGMSPELCYTLDTSHSSHAVITDYTVRRLMPLEYERLQGFPDHFTRIPWRGKLATDCPDGPRYKALGNSMAVPVITWLGKRLNEYLATRC
ncbi:DNA cytosine methyltransferase [Citrobacter sp. wls619]|uniref:DNA cytosine methyltransferase n=1 Tax=Citrobacter sp. wls619 TaxID=2576432 RepID=UPI0010C97D3A|nr:DNA cytosine methyltransferase [Citrobacter sp. wls619]TKV13931.1 DNA cytosine methyltransferase [Citrobacter sp. wls619]